MKKNGLIREKMNEKIDKISLMIFILLMVLLSFNAYALSVASDFLENDTLYLMEGTSELYGFRLQNPSSGEVSLQIDYNSPIAKIVDYEEMYVIPAKSSKSVFFNVSAQNLAPGDSYSVGYTVHQSSGSGSGVGLALKINKNFNVKITENPDKPKVSGPSSSKNFNYKKTAYAAIIILTILILAYIIRKNISK